MNTKTEGDRMHDAIARENARDNLIENLAHGVAILLAQSGDRVSLDAAGVIVRAVNALRVARGVEIDTTQRTKY